MNERKLFAAWIYSNIKNLNINKAERMAGMNVSGISASKNVCGGGNKNISLHNESRSLKKSGVNEGQLAVSRPFSVLFICLTRERAGNAMAHFLLISFLNSRPRWGTKTFHLESDLKSRQRRTNGHREDTFSREVIWAEIRHVISLSAGTSKWLVNKGERPT